MTEYCIDDTGSNQIFVDTKKSSTDRWNCNRSELRFSACTSDSLIAWVIRLLHSWRSPGSAAAAHPVNVGMTPFCCT